MKLTSCVLIVFYLCVTTAEDVDVKDPYLVEVVEFAKADLLKRDELGLENRALHKIVDVQLVPSPQPTPSKYILTLEFGNGCSNDTCKDGSHICEINILDEVSTKTRSAEEGSARCAAREPNSPLGFIEVGSSIANLLEVDDPHTKLLAKTALEQMTERKEGKKHTLKTIGKARKVMIQEANTNYYYLTLYISISEDDSEHEVCEVTLEEVISNPSETTLQSLRCFSTGDEEGNNLGIVPVPSEDLSPIFTRDAILASLAVIDAESVSQFQLRVIGYSLEDTAVSVDSGTRDLQFKLGLVSTFCIKNSEEEEEEAKSCSIDAKRDPSICSITLTQWPWVTDGYLFSNLQCIQSNYETIGEELDTFVAEEFQSNEEDDDDDGDEDAEVAEVDGNDVQQRSADVEEEEEEEEEESDSSDEEEVDEEVSVTGKPVCTGCPSELNPDTEDVLEKANLAVSALESTTNSDKVMSIVRVLRASSQVVNGILYKMTVELAETNCLRSENVDRSNCQVIDDGERRTCSVTLWHQPWIGPPKVQDPLCTEVGADIDARSLKTPLLGGPRENKTLSPDDQDVKMVAEFALSRLDAFDDDSKKRVLVNIYQPRSHIVARSKTYQMNLEVALVDCPEDSGADCPIPESGSHYCAIQVLAQATTENYVPKRLVSSNCYPNQDKTPQVAGAVNSGDNEDEYIQSVAQFATSAINEQINDNNLVKLVRVVRADTQVVAGKRVTLDLEVGFTNCTVGNSAGSCEMDSSRDYMVCRVSVWDRAWLNDRQVTNISCDSLSLLADAEGDSTTPITDDSHKKKSNMLLSAYQPVGADNPTTDSVSEQIEAYADFALAVVQDQSNDDEKLKIVKILASSIQVVQGKNIRLALEIASTNCKKDQSENCSINNVKDYQVCNIQIWDQPWLHQKQVTELQCRPKIKKRTRARKSEDIDESPFVGPAPKSYLLGGPIKINIFKKPTQRSQGGFTTVSPTDTSVSEMADFAAAAISQSMNGPLSLLEVTSAAKQVIAGVKYRMTVLLKGLDNEILSCNALVFDQSWTNTRQLSSFKCKDQSKTVVQRKRRSTLEQQCIPGGYCAVDLESDDVKEIASFAVTEISKSSNSGALRLVRITSALAQVVAGTNYRIGLRLTGSSGSQNCEIEVFDQSWTRTRKLNTFHCVMDAVPPPLPDSQLSPAECTPGGFCSVDVEGDDAKEIASFAVTEMNQSSNLEPLTLIEITSAFSQVGITGLTYKIDLRLNGSREYHNCLAEVFNQSQPTLVSSICIPDAAPLQRSSGESFSEEECISGAFCSVNLEDDDVKEIASFAVTRISQSSNSGPLTLVEITSALSQVVAGTNYKISMRLTGSDGSQTCEIEVFDQPWTETRELNSFNCIPDPTSTPASEPECAPGSYCPVDLEDDNVRDIASFAVTKISQSSNSGPLALLEITSGFYKIVAGTFYKISLRLTGPDQNHKCLIEVFDRSWTDTRTLNKFVCIPDDTPLQIVTEAAPTEPECIPGGYCREEIEDNVVKGIVSFAVSEMSKASNSRPLGLVEIVSAFSQVVAGKNYKINLRLNGSGGTQTCEINVFDQPWTQTRRLETFSCVLDALPRQTPLQRTGGYTEVEINDESVKEMASFTVAEISKSSNSGPLTLIEITSASKQIVSGINYKLGLRLSTADGKLMCNAVIYDQSWTGTRKISSLNCVPESESESTTDDSNTLNKLDQTNQPNQRLGGVHPATPEPEEIPSPNLGRSEPRCIPGGYCAVDLNDRNVKQIASFAVSEISKASNSGPLRLVKITSAFSQVVAGRNFKIGLQITGSEGSQTCLIKVFDQPWTRTRKLETFTCTLDIAPSPSPVPRTGGYTTVETDDESVREMASFAVAEISKSSNFGSLTLVDITSASKQIVSGINYKIGLRLSAADGHQNCEVIIYDQSWTGKRKLTSFICIPETIPVQLTENRDRAPHQLGGFRSSDSSPEFTELSQRPYFGQSEPSALPIPVASNRRRRSVSITGGVTSIDIHDAKVKELTDLAVSTVTQRSNERNTPQLLEVLAATKQVVSGIKYNLNIRIGYSDCTENSKSCLRNEVCAVTIMEKAWLGSQEVTQLTCKAVEKNAKLLRRTKLFGGVKPADPQSKEIRSHASFALQSIQAQSNSPQQLSIVGIKSAATQTMSGQNVYLTIEVAETKCPKNETDSTKCTIDDKADHQLCKVEIWSRPWLNERKISDVKCAPIPSSKRMRSKRQVNRTRFRNMKKINRLEHMTAFRSYAKAFKKIYTTWKEFEHRYKTYRANQKRIQLLNQNEMGTAVYGDTPFSDWTEAEFKQRLNGMKPNLSNGNSRLPQAVIPDVDLPKAFDWRDHNAVTPVKDQGQCGSCWAFSVTGNVEGVYSAKYNELLSLSEQELVDCDTLDSGCNGGLPENAYKAIQDLGGLELESDYPYNGHENKCHFNASIARVKVAGGVEVSTNETKMAQWLIKNGPISIGINANGMQFYRGGISHPWKYLCRADGIDHGVLIVGYGVAEYPRFKKTLPYWIVKNSWGPRWGEQGYYRVYRGDGTCGLNQMATSAIIN